MLLEIDQVASGVMLLSYFLRNKTMAEQSNVIGGSAADPYDYCRRNFEDFYEKHMVERDSNVLKFISSSRKTHKYALMCFSYAQTHIGRVEDFSERFHEEYNRQPDQNEIKVLNEFARKYPDFMHFVFPNTQKQLDIIYKVVDVVVKELGYLPFKNLQGETFQWTFFKYRTTSRSSYDPISLRPKKYKSYKYQEILLKKDVKESLGDDFFEDEEIMTSKLMKDPNTFRRKALSYFIHCIDASIIHRFIIEMRERHGYTVNHLHDCVLVYCNFVENFFDLVKEIYSSRELYDMCDRLFFDHVSSHVSEHTKKEIEELKEKFKEGCDDYSEELINVDPRHVYDFEG